MATTVILTCEAGQGQTWTGSSGLGRRPASATARSRHQATTISAASLSASIDSGGLPSALGGAAEATVNRLPIHISPEDDPMLICTGACAPMNTAKFLCASNGGRYVGQFANGIELRGAE